MTPPRRGEVWIVDLGLAAKVRPAVVLSVPIDDRDRAIATVVPRTTSVRGTRFEAAVDVSFLKPGAFDAQGLTRVPLVHFTKRLGTLRQDELSVVEAAVRLWLGL